MIKTGKITNQSGMTFLELIVVVTLVGIIAGLTGKMFVWGVDMFSFVSERKDTLQSARLGMDIVVRDLRSIEDPADISVAAASAIDFDNFNSETISYDFDAGTLSRDNAALIEGLTGFQFTYFDLNGANLGTPVSDPTSIYKIEIAIDATIDGSPFHLESSVIPRRF